jgi:hypothetical protein
VEQQGEGVVARDGGRGKERVEITERGRRRGGAIAQERKGGMGERERVTGNHATLVDELVKKLDIGVANLLNATPTSARSS